MEKRKVLITGANGFIGKNLAAQLKNVKLFDELYLCDKDTSEKELDRFCRDCDFVFHLAGVNRPKDPTEFADGNYGFLTKITALLEKHKNKSAILLTSSTQAESDNDYGKSKKSAEESLSAYGKKHGVKVFIYRLPNVFGKWSRPNYNSAVATFCYNTARGLPLRIDDREKVLNLVYIDDVVAEFISAARGGEKENCAVKQVYTATVGRIADAITGFEKMRKTYFVPDLKDDFIKKLYSTYLSFLPENALSYDLKLNSDERGSFSECVKSERGGQVSVNVSNPGITKGNHWHHTKNEKFLVLSGSAKIKMRRIGEEKIVEYSVNGQKPQIVDIPPGFTHNIQNTGETELVTLIWANEVFDPANPDTIYEEV